MMKRLAIVLALTLPLGGCITDVFNPNSPSLLQGGTSVTAPIVNPAKPVNIYQVKLLLATAEEAAGEYRDYCYPTAPFVAYADIMKDQIKGAICARRRAIVAKLDSADDLAFDAVKKAEAFIAANPKVSAVSLVQSAYAAVVSFQGAINTTAASVAPVQQ